MQLIPFFALLVQFIATLFYFRKDYKIVICHIIGLIVPFFLFLIWVYFNKYYKSDMESKSWLNPPDLYQLIRMFVLFVNNKYTLAFIGFIGISGIIIFYLKRKVIQILSIIDIKKILIVFLWGVLPVICVYILSMRLPRFIPRYILFSTIGLYIFISYFISNLPLKKIIKAVISIFIMLLLLKNININPYKGEEWDKATSFLKENIKDNTATIVSAWYTYKPFSYYYNRSYFKDYNNLFDHFSSENIFFGNDTGILKSYNFNSYPEVILFLAHYRVVDPDENLLNYFKNSFKLSKSKEFEGIKIYIFSNLEIN